MTFTTDNIDQIEASAGQSPGAWQVRFRSSNAGLCHQLYCNGVLADWTDSPDQRSLAANLPDGPRELCVAAVDPAQRASDYSAMLPPQVQSPGWLCRITFIRSIEYSAAARVAVYDDHAAGTIDPTPLLVEDIWPPDKTRWREDALLQPPSADGRNGPGFGRGAFGGGQFGIDAEAMILRVALAEDGTHELRIRVTDGGQWSERAWTVEVHPPPPSPARLAVTAYDPQTHSLTLQIE